MPVLADDDVVVHGDVISAFSFGSPRPQISAITTARHVESWRPNTSSRLFPSKGPGESLAADSLAQNIPFGLARGMFGAINGAEFFGSPTTCKVSQCSIALP
jgi:hypothetical protein